MGQFSHIQILSSYWMPLALLGFRRYFVRVAHAPSASRWRALGGGTAATVMQNLSCNYYMLFFAPFAAAYCLYEMIQRRLARRGRVWLELAAAAAIVALVTWPFVRPYLEMRAETGLGVRSAAEIVSYSADARAFVTAAANTRWLGPLLPGYYKAEGEGFPGFTILVFALGGLGWGLWRWLATTSWSSMRDWHVAAAVVSGLSAFVASAVAIWFFINGSLTITFAGQTTVYQRADTPLVCAVVAWALFTVFTAAARRSTTSVSSTAAGFFGIAAIAAALLALGPRMEAAGHGLGTGPYNWLLHYVPGFDGLRVPARFLMLVTMFLAVLAGIGAAALLATRHHRIAVLMIIVASGCVLSEAWVVPLPMNEPVVPAERLRPPPPPAGRQVNPIYEVVKKLPEPVVLIEFPFGDVAYEPIAVFYAGYHRRPIVNGYSGLFPAAYTARLPVLRDAPADIEEATEALRATGATHALVHEAAFATDQGKAISAWLVSIGARPVTVSADDRLFALR
jgi:hypothetical protein